MGKIRKIRRLLVAGGCFRKKCASMSCFELCVYCQLTGYLNLIFLWRFFSSSKNAVGKKMGHVCRSDMLCDACNIQYFTSNRITMARGALYSLGLYLCIYNKSALKITWQASSVLYLLGDVIMHFLIQMQQSLLVKEFPLRCHVFTLSSVPLSICPASAGLCKHMWMKHPCGHKKVRQQDGGDFCNEISLSSFYIFTAIKIRWRMKLQIQAQSNRTKNSLSSAI